MRALRVYFLYLYVFLLGGGTAFSSTGFKKQESVMTMNGMFLRQTPLDKLLATKGLFQAVKRYQVFDVKLRVGGTLEIINADKSSKYVVFSGVRFREVLTKRKETQMARFKYKFDSPGIYYVRDFIHPKMRLRVVVEAPNPQL